MDLTEALRLSLMERLRYAHIEGDDGVRRLQFILSMLRDVPLPKENGEIESSDKRVARIVGARAALVLIEILFENRILPYDVAVTELLPDILRFIKDHPFLFDNEELKLRRKMRDGLRWFYEALRKERGSTASAAACRKIFEEHGSLFIECLCAFDLFDLIEEVDPVTLQILERIALEAGPYTVEMVAYEGEDGRSRMAAKQLLYLRGKLAHAR
jgi:hypothetical protein